VPVTDLLQRHPDEWARATRHPFLTAVRDGTLPDGAFDTWLVQDALFVADLLTFQARLLARAPRPAQAVLAAGAASLVAELDWSRRRRPPAGWTWPRRRCRRRNAMPRCCTGWTPPTSAAR
jgi:formylaminopyrimidine deformylase / aminopyrimidine aminohydrolase